VDLKALFPAEGQRLVGMIDAHAGHAALGQQLQEHAAAATDVEDRRTLGKEIRDRPLDGTHDFFGSTKLVKT
jgi:hypothetical protein